MDELVKKAITQAESQAKSASSVPWEFDKPWKQPYYIYSSSEQKWIPSSSSDFQQTLPANNNNNNNHSNINRIALYTWNIDFMLPFPDSRMRAALRHLESAHIANQPPSTETVIFFQECLQSDLELIASDTWVQRTFAITDIDTRNWQSGYYGTITLIDRRLEIAKEGCFRVHFNQTRMQRDGLFVDVHLPITTPNQSGQRQKTLRFCNTHLESLALSPPYRPPQMEMISRYMKVPAAEVDGAAVAGDFNAIQDFDLHLHSDNGLKDAYLELGGREEDKEGGHTWGQQASTDLRNRFGTSRMDKVFFCGEEWRCVDFTRFGAGVELEDEAEQRSIVDLGFERPWITDHLGVKAVFEVFGGDEPADSGGGRSSL